MGLIESLARGRAAAEARMLDTCRITTPALGSTRGLLDPETLRYPSPETVVCYEGRCRLRAQPQATPSASVSGEEAWDTQDVVLSLPIQGSESVAVGSTVTYLTALDDQALPGRTFGVVAVANTSQATARRCTLREVVH